MTALRVLRGTALVAGGLLGVALVGGAVLGGAASPEPSGSPMLTASVERRRMSETLVTRGALRYPSISAAKGRGAGVVTRVSVGRGQIVHAGVEVLRVNGRRVVAVDAGFPFWRDLSVGVPIGHDVRQLEQILVAAGYDPGRVDSTFSHATKAALKRWQKQLGFLPDGIFRAGDVIVSSWPARIGEVHVEVGDDVTPGLELFSLTAAQPRISVSVTPVDRGRLGQGLVARVETPSGVLSGRVASVADAPAIAENGAETYDVVIELDAGTAGTVVEGMFLRVEIVIRESKNAIAVPVAALVLDGQGREGVRVVDENGSTRFAPIATGIVDGAYVEARTGLRGSEVVVLASAE